MRIREDKREWPPWVESITHVAHFLMTVNSSVNFYIYMVKHFRLMRKCSFFGTCGEAGSDESATYTTTTHSARVSTNLELAQRRSVRLCAPSNGVAFDEDGVSKETDAMLRVSPRKNGSGLER